MMTLEVVLGWEHGRKGGKNDKLHR